MAYALWRGRNELPVSKAQVDALIRAADSDLNRYLGVAKELRRRAERARDDELPGLRDLTALLREHADKCRTSWDEGSARLDFQTEAGQARADRIDERFDEIEYIVEEIEYLLEDG